MSRTRRGSKPVGFDYWGKRPKSQCCGFGPIVKQISKRIERARSKAAVMEGKELPAREAF